LPQGKYTSAVAPFGELSFRLDERSFRRTSTLIFPAAPSTVALMFVNDPICGRT
jgi:hypothetical protein